MEIINQNVLYPLSRLILHRDLMRYHANLKENIEQENIFMIYLCLVLNFLCQIMFIVIDSTVNITETLDICLHDLLRL